MMKSYKNGMIMPRNLKSKFILLSEVIIYRVLKEV